MLDGTHTFANILRMGEFCVNYPAFKDFPACCAAIAQNGPENNEICDAGFTLKAAQAVSAPRIAKCFFNLECRLEWNRSIHAGSQWQNLLARVVHVAVDEAVMVPEPEECAHRMGLMYNMRSNVNALTGEYYGPNTLGLLNEIVKITPES